MYCLDRPETPEDALIISEMQHAEEKLSKNESKEQAIRSYEYKTKYRTKSRNHEMQKQIA